MISLCIDLYLVPGTIRKSEIKINLGLDLESLDLDLGPSASQSSDGGASAAFRILVDSSLHCCLFWAMHLRCSRSSLVVSCNVFSCSLDGTYLEEILKYLLINLESRLVKKKKKKKRGKFGDIGPICVEHGVTLVIL